MNHSPGPRLAESQGRAAGFAVVLTLGLLALLMLVLLALATLIKIETRISATAVRQAQARQNATMALQIALGQIQKFAGPDPRVTATAAAFGGATGTSRYTGVWDALAADPAPLIWLVSGSEGPYPREVSPRTRADSVELVGVNTSGVADDVVAPRQAITANHGSGQTGSALVGHYAWWVGDQGVKAAVALADRTGNIGYAPYDSGESRRRIRQQVTLGAGPADAAGTTVFEPREGINALLVSRIIDFRQLAFLRLTSDNSVVGPDLVRRYFHSWSEKTDAVLAMTRPGGLRRDLSRKPELLGAAFAAWADYAHYMEDPAAPAQPRPSPAFPASNPREALRRRYRMTAPLAASGITHGVAPVLSFFLVTFNIRTDQSASGTTRPLEVRTRWLATLWNPYSSSLVPEDLQLEVTGLPAVQVVDASAGAAVASLALDPLFGGPLRIGLAWQTAGRDDQQSWLPGRVYTWASEENLNKTAPAPAAGFPSAFYTRSLSAAAGQGVQRAVPFATMPNSAQTRLQGNTTQLTVRLYRTLAGGGRELLRTHVSPPFDAFVTTPAPASAATYQFSYVFHLAESTDTPSAPDIWLTTAGRDPREAVVPAGSFVSGANGPRPELYPNYTSISFPDRLLDRALPASATSATGQSYNEDVPLFELPRGPVLSLGELQHVPVEGARPFAIGNSWGQSGGWNSLFDQYFFSGLAPGVGPPDPLGTGLLPNSLLHILPQQAEVRAPASGDSAGEADAGYTAKYLLQGGAFNINSVDPLAWLAVLRSGRFVAGTRFAYLAANPSTGTQADAPAAEAVLGDSVFFRFPFSAQETYRSDAGYAASTTVPPAAPSTMSPANTQLFRRGVRVLSTGQTVALAEMIVKLLRQRHALRGPFRSLEEFLGPAPEFGGKSLLEEAIAGAAPVDEPRINDPSIVSQFSSQWLTQGDILSLLAPVLFPRSDTFLVRAYGDAVNPVTGAIEGRAWCEATVQRFPEFLDASQPAETSPDVLNLTNQTYGRRFQVVAFRWLTSADI
jgi:hypothetical protein